MIEHIDRVPTKPNRYAVYDEEHNFLRYEYHERADEPVQAGNPFNKALQDDFLAASGTTAGTASALTLAQPGFMLTDGATVRVKFHTNVGPVTSLNIQNTGIKPIKTAHAGVVYSTFYGKAGAWYYLIYSSTHGAYFFNGATDYIRSGGKSYIANVTEYRSIASLPLTKEEMQSPPVEKPIWFDSTTGARRVVDGEAIREEVISTEYYTYTPTLYRYNYSTIQQVGSVTFPRVATAIDPCRRFYDWDTGTARVLTWSGNTVTISDLNMTTGALSNSVSITNSYLGNYMSTTKTKDYIIMIGGTSSTVSGAVILYHWSSRTFSTLEAPLNPLTSLYGSYIDYSSNAIYRNGVQGNRGRIEYIDPSSMYSLRVTTDDGTSATLRGVDSDLGFVLRLASSIVIYSKTLTLIASYSTYNQPDASYAQDYFANVLYSSGVRLTLQNFPAIFTAPSGIYANGILTSFNAHNRSGVTPSTILVKRKAELCKEIAYLQEVSV